VGLTDGSGNKLAGSYEGGSAYALDTNLWGSGGTAFTTAGLVDVKGTDGNVFVRSNAASTFPVTATPNSGSVFEVGPTGSANTKTNPFFNALTDGTNVITAAISAWGTAPTGTYVQGVNAELFQGATAIGTGNPLQVSLANTGANTNKLLVTADAITLAAAQTLATVTTVSTVTAVTTITNAVKVEGNAGGAFDAAQGGTPPANAVQISSIAATALPTAATATDTVVPMADKYGRAVTLPQAPRDLIGAVSVQNTGVSGTLVGQIASTFVDITNLILTNETGTATVVSISDGTTTYKFALAANGGGVFPFSPPLPAATVNTNWTISNSASSTIDAVVTYVKNK